MRMLRIRGISPIMRRCAPALALMAAAGWMGIGRAGEGAYMPEPGRSGDRTGGAGADDGERQRSVSLYQGRDGAFALFINNDFYDVTLDAHVGEGVFFLYDEGGPGAFNLPSGGVLSVYLPAKAYRLEWRGAGDRAAAAQLTTGQTAAIAFEPFGPDHAGLRAVIADGAAPRRVALTLEPPPAPLSPDALPAALPASASLGSSPEVGTAGPDRPPMPGVTLTAGVFTGALDDAALGAHFRQASSPPRNDGFLPYRGEGGFPERHSALTPPVRPSGDAMRLRRQAD